MRKEWLTEKVPFEEVDASLRSGGLAEKWARLVSLRQDGDVIFAFDSSAASWRSLAGRSGYALVRDGEILDCIVTLMN